MSISGGIAKSVSRALDIGCESFQIFSRNQRQWNPSPISDRDAELFGKELEASGLGPVLVHGSYLVNPASGEEDIRKKSLKALADELFRCELLGLEYLVIHPGSHRGKGPEAGMSLVASAADEVLERSRGVMILLETTAGQGTGIGHTLEQLSGIIERSSFPEKLGICLDTCHMHAAGYDLTSEEGYELVMERMDQLFGLEKLKGVHLNDSLKGRGEKRDRHTNIGMGTIGKGAFENLVNDGRLKGIPMVLETPGGDEAYRKDLHFLRSLRKR